MSKHLLIQFYLPFYLFSLIIFPNNLCFGQNLDLNCKGSDFEKKVVIDLSPFCPPVIHQGKLSSCTGYGNGYYAMSLMYNKALNITDTLLKRKFAFSANFPYDMIEDNKDGAVNPIDVHNNMKTLGNIRYNEYDMLDYSEKMGEKTKSKFITEASKFKIISFQCIVDPETDKKGNAINKNSIERIKCALLKGYPVTANISQTSAFYNLKKRTYIPTTDDIYVGEHMITILGYNDEAGRFQIVNSNGVSWGDSGYAYISYNDLLEMVNYAYIFQIDTNPETLSNYEIISPENDLPGICSEQNTINLNRSFFQDAKYKISTNKISNAVIVASEPYIDGNIITVQRELKDDTEIIYLKKLSPEGTILTATEIISPLIKGNGTLFSAQIATATDGSIMIVLTIFDGANYYNYFAHYDFRLIELKKITHLLDSQGKEYTPVSNIIFENHMMYFVIHDNYFYLYKYNIRRKEILRSIVNYEDLNDPLKPQRIRGLQSEVQNLHLIKILDDRFLVVGTYEINFRKDHNGFGMVLDASFKKQLKFNEIKSLKLLTYIQNVIPVNKQEFLIAGNLGCDPFLYFAEISNNEINILKKYKLASELENYHLAVLTDAALIGDQVVVSLSVNDEPTMTGSIFPLVVKVPINEKQPSSEELYQKGYTNIHKIIRTQENKLVFVSEKTKDKHPYINTFFNYCDGRNYATSPNFKAGDHTIWQSSTLLNSNTESAHPLQSWVVTHTIASPIEFDSVALVPIILTPKEAANALCNPYLDIICNQKDKVGVLERIYLPPMTKRVNDTLYIPLKNKGMMDNEEVKIQFVLGHGNKNIASTTMMLSGKTRQVSFNVSGKISDPKTGEIISNVNDNMAVSLDLDIQNLSNVNLQKVEIEFPDLGNAFSTMSDSQSYPLKAGRNQLNKASFSNQSETLKVKFYIDEAEAFKPLKINLYLNGVLHKKENIQF